VSNILIEIKKLGVEIVFVLAGIGGAFVSIESIKNYNWREVAFILMRGGILATYLTPLVIGVVKVSDTALISIAFVVGYMGLKSVKMATEFITRIFKKQ